MTPYLTQNKLNISSVQQLVARLVLGVILFAGSFVANAQQYPVQVTTTITPPYSLYLSDYTAVESNSLQVLINLLELDRTNLRVKLRVTLEGAGVTLRTRPSYVPPAIVLQGGVPELLTGFDIRSYLNADNLEFSGITKREFLRSGKLPEGFYTLTVEVLEYNRNVRVSNQSMANAWIVLNDPPLINMPFNGDKLTATDPQNITFSWTPRHTASPNAAFTTEYEFKLVEMYPGQSNPDVAIRSSNSIFKTTTTQTSLNYNIINPTLIPGKKYAFRVRAYDTSGRDLFKNNGYSETYVFQYGDACILPTEIEAEALDPNRVRFQWESAQVHSSFTLKYRRKGSDEWFTKDTYGNSQIIPELSGQTAYEYQVQAKCGTIIGDVSPIYTVNTPEADESAFVCGSDMPDFELNPNPLQKPLLPNDMIKTADWDIKVETAVAAGNGVYNGKGFALVPLFNKASIRVKFENIEVNEDYRVIGGIIRTVYSENSRFVADLRDKEEELGGPAEEDDTGEADGSESDEEENSGEEVPGDDIIIAGEIVDVTENEDGTVTVTREDGSEEVITPNDDGDIVLTDDSGDQWVVDSGGNVSGGPAGGGSTDTSSGDLASGNSLDEGEVSFGPISVVFDAIPESISTDDEGYCTYENITAQISLSVRDNSVAEASFTIPDATVSFKQHCENKEFKDVSISYENTLGLDIGKIGFIDALIKTANLSVDNEGNVDGDLAFSASLNEDQTIQEVFRIKQGLSGDFSFAFSGGQNFNGSFDLGGIEGVNLELRKSSTLIASLNDGFFNSSNVLTGTFNLGSGAVSFTTPYLTSTVKSLSIDASYSFIDGLTLNSGTAQIEVSEMKGLTGAVTMDLSYLENNVTTSISSSSLEGFGMAFSNLNLKGEMDQQFNLLELSGAFKAKHSEFDASLNVTGFLFNDQGLQTFEASGGVSYEGVEFVIENANYNSSDEVITLDALAKVTSEGVEAVVSVTGFTIDSEGNISYNEINAEVESDVTLGPILVKFNGNAKRNNREKVDGKVSHEYSGDGKIMLKTITKNGKEIYKEIDKVEFVYRKYKNPEDGGVLYGSLSWEGDREFGTINGINISLKGLSLSIDEEENLSGDLSFGAGLEEDKVIRDLFLLKKGLSGSVSYAFAGNKSFEGDFDFSGLQNINVIAKKGDTELASLKNGTFNGTVLTGNFEALPNAAYTSNSFDLKLDQLNLNGSYDLSKNELTINSGTGKVTASNIQGVTGDLVLGVEYGVDGNFSASVESESSLSALGFTFSDFNLNVTFTKNFDLEEITGGVKAEHDMISTKVNISTFTVRSGKLTALDASGDIVYRGFDFDLSKCTYANNILTLDAKLAINATGAEAKFGVKDFVIDSEGEISLREVSGNLDKGDHLSIGFDIKMEESRFTGEFTGKIKTIGIGVEGKLDIGKQADFNFAYLELAVDGNFVLGATGLKITTIGGQIGYNYELVYNQSSNSFSGNPKDGNYVLGLKLGVADVANLCEIVGNPIVQFSSSSLSISLQGTVQITRNTPMISSNLTAHYALPDNTLAGAINTSFKVPRTSGAIFNANCDIGFGVGNNQWYAQGNNISASFLGALTYSGNFHYGGQVDPFFVNAISLNGQVEMAFDFEFEGDYGVLAFAVDAEGNITSYINTELSVENGLVGEVGVDVHINLTCTGSAFGYDFDPVEVTADASGRVGFDNGHGYVTGSISASVTACNKTVTVGPRDYDYSFDTM